MHDVRGVGRERVGRVPTCRLHPAPLEARRRESCSDRSAGSNSNDSESNSDGNVAKVIEQLKGDAAAKGFQVNDKAVIFFMENTATLADAGYNDITELAKGDAKKVKFKKDIVSVVTKAKKEKQPQAQPQSQELTLFAEHLFDEEEEEEEEVESNSDSNDYSELDELSIKQLEDGLASADARLDLFKEEKKNNPIKMEMSRHKNVRRYAEHDAE